MSKADTQKEDSLKPQQGRALIHLAFLGGEVLKADDLKPKLDAKLRKALEIRKMLSAKKEKRCLRITLEDSGWRWVMENLATELPRKEQVAGMLMAVLARLAEFLKVNRLDVQDVILARRIAPTEETPVDQDQDKSAEHALLRVAIELGNGHIAERIRLRDLRPRMENLGYSRAVADDAIRALQLDGILSVIPIDLPSDIDELDRAAIINIAGEPRHAVIVRRRPSDEPTS